MNELSIDMHGRLTKRLFHLHYWEDHSVSGWPGFCRAFFSGLSPPCTLSSLLSFIFSSFPSCPHSVFCFLASSSCLCICVCHASPENLESFLKNFKEYCWNSNLPFLRYAHFKCCDFRQAPWNLSSPMNLISVHIYVATSPIRDLVSTLKSSLVAFCLFIYLIT